MNKQEIEKAIDELDIQTKATSCTVSIKSCQLAISTLTQQLTNGWIPVSERLPNIGETVLLTVAVNRGISHEYGSVDIAWICDKENKCFYGTDGKYSHDEAIAWQPLPEPYEETPGDEYDGKAEYEEAMMDTLDVCDICDNDQLDTCPYIENDDRESCPKYRREEI